MTDLGNGLAATKVPLGVVSALAAAPDGSLYVATDQARVWRLLADGTLVTAVGRASPATGTGAFINDGLPGPLGVVGRITALAVDAKGRLLMVDERGATRLDADGTLRVLVPANANVVGCVPGDGDDVFVLEEPFGDGHDTLVHVSGEAEPIATVQLDRSSGTSTFGAFARDAQGTLLAKVFARDPGTAQLSAPAIVKLDAKTGTTSVVPADGTGVLLPDGAVVPASQLQAPGASLAQVGPTARGHDGTYWVAEQADTGFSHARGVVYKGGSSWTPVAGLLAAPDVSRPVPAETLPLFDPTGTAVGPDGTVYVSERGTHQVLRLGGNGQVSAYVGVAQADCSNLLESCFKPGPGLATGLSGPSGLHADATGALYVLPDGLPPGFPLVHVDAGGVAATIQAVAAGGDVAVGPGGTFAVATLQGGLPAGIKAVDVAGQITNLPAFPPDPDNVMANYAVPSLAYGPDGTLYAAEGDRLVAWVPGGAAWQVKLVNVRNRVAYGLAGLALDAHGRFFIASDDVLYEADPATGKVQVLAGQGGKAFAGTTADTSVGQICGPAVAPDGSVVFVDRAHRQVKRVSHDLL